MSSSLAFSSAMSGLTSPRARSSTPTVFAAALQPSSAKADSRTAILTHCEDVNGVVATIPITYREVLRPELQKLFALALKMGNAESSRRTLIHHQTHGSFPSTFGGLKSPVIQLGKEFDVEEATPYRRQYDAILIQAKKDLLTAQLTMKTAEIAYFSQGPLASGTYASKLEALVDTHWKDTRIAMYGGDQTGPSHMVTEYNAVRMDAPLYGARVIEIARSRTFLELKRKDKKLSLKKSADVEMADAGSASIQDLVMKEITAALKKAGISKGMSKIAIPSHETNQYRPKRQREEQAERQEEPNREETEAARQTKRKRCQQEADEEKVRGMEFHFFSPSTYPNEILKLTPKQQLSVLSGRMPLNRLVDRRRFLPGPHVQEGLQIPLELQGMIGAGLRFLFWKRGDVTVVNKAWEIFENSIRWQYRFREREQNVEPFNPKFKITKERNLSAPLAPQAIETALRIGKEQIIHQIHLKPTYAPDLEPTIKDFEYLTQFCLENNLLIKLTDKNLGTAVIRKEWYLEKVNEHLSNRELYRKIPNDIYLIGDIQDELAEILERHRLQFTSQELQFMNETAHNPLYPQFHAIPKIHKQPWGIRPIVPSHSWVTSNAAKVVSHHLKPVIAQVPWIAQSTSDITDALRKEILSTHTPQGMQMFFATGDVRAMYTNIPVGDSSKVIKDLLQDARAVVDMSVEKATALSEIIDLCNRRNYFVFNNDTYQQKDGIAMGISCSPDVANLYAASYENASLSGADEPNTDAFIRMYRRYIDDVFCIIIAKDRTSAMAKLHTINLGPTLVIDWSLDDDRVIFLDLEIFQENSEVRWKPYSKPMNLYQRIPWLSAHPKQVKKATFVAELARLARNSSHYEYYLQACSKFKDILRARGWPYKILHSWYKEEGDKRWAQRFTVQKSGEEAPPLVIPTTYNLIWENVRMEPVRQAMLSALTDYALIQGPLNGNATEEPLPSTPTEVSTPSSFGGVSQPSSLGNRWVGRRRPGTNDLSSSQGTPQPLPGVGTAAVDWMLGKLQRRLILAQGRTTSMFDMMNNLNRVVMMEEDNDMGFIRDADGYSDQSSPIDRAYL